jgi:hypothetical protein
LKSKGDAETALEVNAATITDNYWFCPSDSNLTYEDICFRYNFFDKVALQGDPNGFSLKPSRTPELTNIGSFEKCWRNIDGQWWLYKAGKAEEYFSELFICRLGMAMNFPMAWYEMHDGYIRTKDFTDGRLNFEAMDGLAGDNEDYEFCFNELSKISLDIGRQYLKIIWLDTICYNMDRHTKNFGLLRAQDSGDILCMAPNYDNNIALISRGYLHDVSRKQDGLIRFFSDFISENKEVALTYKDMIESGEIPIVDGDLVDTVLNEVLEELPTVNINRKYVHDFILRGQKEMQLKLNENS